MRLFMDWAYTLVAGALIAVVIDTLAPKGKLGNGVKLITVLFLLLCAASPLLSINGTGLTSITAFSTQNAAMEPVEEELREQMLTLAGDRIRERLSLALEEEIGEGIRVLSVDTTLDDAGNILVSAVSLTLPKSLKDQSESVQALLREEFAKEVRVSMEVVEEIEN